MKTLASVGFCFSLSILTVVWIPQARSEAIAPPASPIARDLSEYVYLHVTRDQSVSVQGPTRASTCRGTRQVVRS